MRDYSTICCPKTNPVPPTFCCMWSEIVDGYNELCKRYSKTTTSCLTKHSRLRILAEPKHIEPKYQSNCICSNVALCKVKPVDIVDQTTNTRIEQLAFPKARYVSELREQKLFENFNDERKSVVNRLLRKSLLSVYSRLMNVKPVAKESKAKPIEHNVRNKLMRNLEKLSTPKKDFSIEKKKIKNIRSRFDNRTPRMKNIAKLSKPKKYTTSEAPKWKLTDALKYYKPTERILKISRPKYRSNQYSEPYRIQPNVLTYNATSRIMILAEPHQNNYSIEKKVKNPFRTNRTALKAVASKRIIELASPRDHVDTNNRSSPFKVSNGALRAKSSARIQKLAEPKRRNS